MLPNNTSHAIALLIIRHQAAHPQADTNPDHTEAKGAERIAQNSEPPQSTIAHSNGKEDESNDKQPTPHAANETPQTTKQKRGEKQKCPSLLSVGAFNLNRY